MYVRSGSGLVDTVCAESSILASRDEKMNRGSKDRSEGGMQSLQPNSLAHPSPANGPLSIPPILEASMGKGTYMSEVWCKSRRYLGAWTSGTDAVMAVITVMS